MRLFVTIMFAVVSVSTAQQHQQLDPAYLRQYYAQIGQQGGAQPAQRAATPIFEEQPQYLQQAAPLKNVSSISFRFILFMHFMRWRVAVMSSNCNLVKSRTVPKTGSAANTSLRARAAAAPSKTIPATAATATGNNRR